ncbi:Domain of unkown function [Micromonospora phaseoli]|uniref:Domain of unkown function n=2 Tax=Micromonospora phaseoli TaxID=1144548 RepID=A0A1H6SLQ1_9ACTN|nr:uncharacterized protein DUF1775 [Micromonospora phaseoli]GIJ77568.1 hypothetical protein Xph01_20000 [Micromonospora phaseoli]SEI68878.1 Domain of unkown function [Micromonospora phaseoli]
MTRGGSRRRRGALVAALATAVVLLWPATAQAAEVSFTPTEARQGESVKLEFVVPDERPGVPTESIEIRVPADPPIAEVYPLSVDGWAPLITTRKLDTPVAGLHAPATDVVTAAVTWSRTPDAGDGPARLLLSMGPLPQTDRLDFELLQTYADGMVVRWGPGQRPLPALALLPGDPAAPGAHGGHGGVPGGQPPAEGAPAGAASDGGPNANSLLAAGLVAGLGGGAVVGWLISRRRRSSTQEIDRSVLDGEPTAVHSGSDGDSAPAPGGVESAERAGSDVAEAGARR